MEQKRSSSPYPTETNNYRWETATVYISVAEEAIINSTGRFDDPLEFWRCTNPPRYHKDRFHAYRNCPNQSYPGVADR